MRDYADIVSQIRIAAIGVKKPSNRLTMMELAADAIEELLAAVPKWISVEERLPERTNPTHARDTYLVRLESGCIKTLFYEYDNSERCRPGMSPLFSEGWEKTAVPVTHWMPLPEPPKEVE